MAVRFRVGWNVVVPGGQCFFRQTRWFVGWSVGFLLCAEIFVRCSILMKQKRNLDETLDGKP